MNPFSFARLWLRSRSAARYASANPFPGQPFDRFGRSLGYSLLRRGRKNGFGYVINPVSMIRYFEFAFALECFKNQPGECLDVSSPRLFAYYVANRFPHSPIHMINPDAADIAHSAIVVRKMGWSNVTTACTGIDLLEREDRLYDTIWSLSVIEHIAGTYDDTMAVKLMYKRLRPGGRLILTTMVDRTSWDEYRGQDYYGTQPGKVAGKHFFQRWYDEPALEQRILASLGVRPIRIEWLGEIVPGRFRDYERRWIDGGGWNVTVDDVREFLQDYRSYNSWHDMPGVGAAGVLFEKPLL